MRSIRTNTRNVDQVRFNLTLIRHAETYANANGIIQGSLDTELSNLGYLQSRALGRYLQYHRFSHIYSSDLKRASETARLIHLLNRVSSCEIQFDRLLRERVYGIAQGHRRQWLHELAKESGVPYSNFTPPGAETIAEVRERAVLFFQKLCHELLIQFGTKQTPSLSTENLVLNHSKTQRSISTGNIHAELTRNIILTTSCQSSIDSALDLTSLSSDQQSLSSSSSIFSRNNSVENQRDSLKDAFSDLDVLVVSHGAIIRELIKYFACDLQTDLGEHFDTIQELPPNTSITRFHVTLSMNEHPTTLELIDYYNKTHLITDEVNLDITNRCSF